MSITSPQIVVYVDNDDLGSAELAQKLGIQCFIGPRITLTQCWNELLPFATGSILMQGNDDFVMRTYGWDVMVEEAFAESKDKILMVHGSDGGSCHEKFGIHPIVHKRWVNAVGYFIAPYFSSDFGDTWLNEVANGLDRRKYLPFVVEHMHHIYGKAEVDQTTRDRLRRHGQDDVHAVYRKLEHARHADIAKLKKLINTPVQKEEVKFSILILTQPSRREFLKRLLATLKPQVDKVKGVEIDIRMFDPALSLGNNRQVMRENARGEYSCFVDDDDLVPDNYVELILSCLGGGVDYVGFRMQCYVDGTALQPTYHSLKYNKWYSDSNGHYRDLSHLNPIKNDLALKVTMAGGYGEDSRWSEDLRKLDVVKTEAYIAQCMYLYYVRTTKNDDDFNFQYPARKITLPPVTYPVVELKKECPIDNCRSVAVTIFSNGFRCNECGHQFPA